MIQLLTVSYNSHKLLQWCKYHFDNLNPGLKYEWHVIDNALGKFKKTQGLIYHDGVEQPKEHLSLPNQKGKLYIGSIHHGLGLNEGLQYLDWNSDLIIVIDPDFLLLTPLQPIIDRINSENLWFFGACYSNLGKNYIRSFPCGYCQFINPKFVKKEDLDYSVGYGDYLSDYYPDVGYKVMYKFINNPECKYYGISKNIDDMFFYKSGKFGLHLSAKPHLYGFKHKIEKLKHEIGL